MHPCWIKVLISFKKIKKFWSKHDIFFFLHKLEETVATVLIINIVYFYQSIIVEWWIIANPTPKCYANTKQTVIGHLRCQSDGLLLSEWAVLGQKVLHSGSDFLPSSQRSGYTILKDPKFNIKIRC